MTIYALGNDTPKLEDGTYVADSATVIGKVHLGQHASVWPQAVVRADSGESINIGACSNIQDGAVLHTDPGFTLSIGDDVSVGHHAMLHGCTVGSGSMIGIGAIILNGASIGKNSLVAAGAVVLERRSFPENSLIVGAPAKALRVLSSDEIDGLLRNAADYVERSNRYRTELRSVDNVS